MNGSRRKLRNYSDTPLPERPPELDQSLSLAGDLVRDLAYAARHDSAGTKHCPATLRRVLTKNAWRHFQESSYGRVFSYGADEFDTFVRAKSPAGLGLPDGIDGLIRLCVVLNGDKDSAKCLRLIRELVPAAATNSEAGSMGGRGHKAVDNVNRFKPKGGNNETYLLRRLKRDYPALAQQVVEGKLTAHAAGRRAGFVKPIVQHLATVEGFGRAARKHLTAAEWIELISLPWTCCSKVP